MTEISDRFIILKKIKYGESDLIIHALSSQGAKFSFMAKGALKSKKRFGGGILEPTHFVNFSYKNNNNEGKLKLLCEATLIDDFKDIRSQYEKLDFALFALNCAACVSQEGDVHSDFLFNLLGHTLRAAGTTTNISLLKLHFCLKFLFQQGVISIEDWMSEFLKFNISDHEKLAENDKNLAYVDTYLDSMESLVLQYIKTADAGF